MKGLIIEDELRDYAYFNQVIEALDGEQMKYNWLITEIDYAPANNELEKLKKPYTWISGLELTKRVKQDDGFWVWGVFSGFDKSISIEEVLAYELPKANGYAGFWQRELTIQHPLASVELVEWDGGLFLAITENHELLNNLSRAFPSAQDLLEYIKSVS